MSALLGLMIPSPTSNNSIRDNYSITNCFQQTRGTSITAAIENTFLPTKDMVPHMQYRTDNCYIVE